MRTSSDHILTSHAGSLPRPDDLIEAWGGTDERALAEKLTTSVAEVVQRQASIGLDLPGDGEFGKPMAQRVNYGSWWRYSWNRLGGLDPHGPSLYEMEARRSSPGHVVLTSFGDRRDRTHFAAAYNDPESGITTGPRPPAPICVAPVHYAGHDAIRRDIANFKAALQAAGVEDPGGRRERRCGLQRGVWLQADADVLFALPHAWLRRAFMRRSERHLRARCQWDPGDGLVGHAGRIPVAAGPWRHPPASAIRDPRSAIRVIYAEGAGCYGQNGADDVAADAALMSQLVGRPVRVQWMRWDEHAWEPLGPAMAHTLKGALDLRGNVVAWSHTVNSPPHSSRPGGGGSLLAGQEIGLIPPPLPTQPVNQGTRNGR